MNGLTLIQIVLGSAIAIYAVLGVRVLYAERKSARLRALKRQKDAYEVEFVRARLFAENSALAVLRSPMPEQHVGASAQETVEARYILRMREGEMTMKRVAVPTNYDDAFVSGWWFGRGMERGASWAKDHWFPQIPTPATPLVIRQAYERGVFEGAEFERGCA